jgi:predicted acyl esterase
MTTPYDKDNVCGCPATMPFVSRGYLVAVVDVRGTGASEGAFELSCHGHDKKDRRAWRSDGKHRVSAR